MSIGLFRYNRNAKITLSESIATQKFYERCWQKAIGELGIRFIQDGAEFNKLELNNVLKELDLLKEWATNNLREIELRYMVERIETLKNIIPNSFVDDDTVLYIF